jgi:hypothetical protein
VEESQQWGCPVEEAEEAGVGGGAAPGLADEGCAVKRSRIAWREAEEYFVDEAFL